MTIDTIVIGGGHNGLVAAHQLAKAGRKVLLLERRSCLGGLAAREEFYPGYTAPGVLQDTSTLRPEVVRALDLGSHGLQFRSEAPAIYAASASDDSSGDSLVLPGSREGVISALETISRADAVAYRRWVHFIDRVRPFVQELLSTPPPPLGATSFGDLWTLGRRGLALRRLGKADMLEFMRVVPMSVADWLNENFETSRLKELLAAPAVISTFTGPWAAGSAANLLFYECTRQNPVVGGAAALIDALERAASARGVEIRTSAAVSRIKLTAGRATGVVLEDGTEIEAGTIVSTCDPKTTFLRLINPSDLPIKVEETFATWRARGTTAILHLALSGPLELQGKAGARLEHIRLGGGHLDFLEKAADAVKYGQFSSAPYLEITVPSLENKNLAPAGHHVATVGISYVPYHLRAGWNDELRHELLQTVIHRLSQPVPTLRDVLVGHELLTPVDLEQRYGTAGGHLHHGEHSLDQLLFMRPNALAARYKTPVHGLFLGGSGSHPGGGITGMPGLLGAAAALRRE